MAAKRRKAPTPPHTLQRLWQQYGTWVTTAVTVVLAVVLVGMLFQRHRERELRKGEAELLAVRVGDPGAAMVLKRLALEYGDTKLGPRIQLKHAQALLRSGDLDEAEGQFARLLQDEAIRPLERVQAHLGLAYVAQEKGHLEEARRRFERVEEDGLYASEARRMLELIDSTAEEKVPEEPAPDASGGTSAPE